MPNFWVEKIEKKISMSRKLHENEENDRKT